MSGQQRGITQHPLVQLAAVLSILAWIHWTYTQEPVYGRLLRRALLFTFVGGTGIVALIIGVAVQPWWVTLTVLSVGMAIVTYAQITERKDYNRQWLEEQATEAEIAEIIAEQEEFQRSQILTEEAERRMAERRTVRIGDQDIDVEEFNARNAEAHRRNGTGR